MQFLCEKKQQLFTGIRRFTQPDYSGFLGNRRRESQVKVFFPMPIASATTIKLLPAYRLSIIRLSIRL
jgi:hypothetical protein